MCSSSHKFLVLLRGRSWIPPRVTRPFFDSDLPASVLISPAFPQIGASRFFFSRCFSLIVSAFWASITILSRPIPCHAKTSSDLPPVTRHTGRNLWTTHSGYWQIIHIYYVFKWQRKTHLQIFPWYHFANLWQCLLTLVNRNCPLIDILQEQAIEREYLMTLLNSLRTRIEQQLSITAI